VGTQRVSPEERRSVEFLARADKPFDEDEFKGLSGEQVDEVLRRLHAAGLIEGQRAAFSGRELRTRWTNLRVTARGLMALGEWPDLDRVATAVGVHGLLTALAEHVAEPEKKSLLQRAAGATVGFGDQVVRATLVGIVGSEITEALEP
jgi:hypothetical protein